MGWQVSWLPSASTGTYYIQLSANVFSLVSCSTRRNLSAHFFFRILSIIFSLKTGFIISACRFGNLCHAEYFSCQSSWRICCGLWEPYTCNFLLSIFLLDFTGNILNSKTFLIFTYFSSILIYLLKSYRRRNTKHEDPYQHVDSSSVKSSLAVSLSEEEEKLLVFNRDTDTMYKLAD